MYFDQNSGAAHLLLCLCQHKKRAPKNNEINSNVKRPLVEQRKVFGARIKIVQEEQLVE